jgi:hypothetical protein
MRAAAMENAEAALDLVHCREAALSMAKARWPRPERSKELIQL